ncbi:MAG TPA: zf-TFIIB domain-containing protein [Chroococcidiopsis sp.]
MQCPKDRTVELVGGTLAGDLPVQCCADCGGNWIPPENYHDWRARHDLQGLDTMPKTLDDLNYVQSPLDSKGGLCPDCGCFLSRSKVGSRNPFYVERCPKCGGIWCDRGEWDVLEKLGLTGVIDQLFMNEWQVRLREREWALRERQATIDKLGEDLAQLVFDLAEQLEKHPNGDFGVAYLMRRFAK